MAAGGVDADGPLEFVNVVARGVAVDDEGWAGPAIGPGHAGGAVGAFAGAAFGVEDLDAGDDGGGLFLPGLVGQKAAVDEDDVQLGLEVGERHLFEVLPVVGLEAAEGGFVVVFEEGAIGAAANGEEAGFVIAEEGEGAVLEREIDDAVAVRAAVHEVADQDEAVLGGEGQALEQFGKFLVAAVDVADGDDASDHAGGGGGWGGRRKC